MAIEFSLWETKNAKTQSKVIAVGIAMIKFMCVLAVKIMLLLPLNQPLFNVLLTEKNSDFWDVKLRN